MNERPPDADGATLPPREIHNTLDLPSADPDATLAPQGPAADAASPCAFPGYELLGELGRGGMGVVYKARQVSLKRLVALKVVLGGAHAASESFGRFRAEAEAVAKLQHPNIVQVYEVGAIGETPYFSLEYCEGGSLDRKLAGTPLPPREAAELVRTLAHAVQHAHDHDVVHRDLKPANVLLAADRTPKVTDFGLAKQMRSDSGQTRSGAILGTPSYMAPEQAGGDTKAVGPPADIYALGAILYECLTGHPPFRAATPLDTVLQVLNDEPLPPTRTQPKTPRDLETICLKCLHKKVERRYATATELAEDLTRFLDDEPILARPMSRFEKLRLWRKKNPAKFRLIAASIGIAIAFNFINLKDRNEAREYAKKVQLERTAAEAAKRVAEAQKHEAEVAKGQAQDAKIAVQAEKDAAVARLYASSIDLAYREWRENNVLRAEQLLNECPPPLRGWEWDFVKRLCRQDLLRLTGHYGAVEKLAVAADGKTLASDGLNDNILIWNLETGQETAKFPTVTTMALSPDGKLLATCSGQNVRVVALADARVVRQVHTAAGDVIALAFTPDAKEVYAVTQSAGVYNFPVAEGPGGGRSKSFPAFDYTATVGSGRPTFNRDCTLVVGSTGMNAFAVFDARTGAKKFSGIGHSQHVNQVVFSPDGNTLASASGDALVILWDVKDGKELRRLRGHTGEVNGVTFSPDGRLLASGSEDNSVRVWDVAAGEQIMTFRGHTADVLAVAFTPDGTKLVSAGRDKVVRVWDAVEPTRRGPGNFFTAMIMNQAFKGRRLTISEGGQTYYGHPNPTLSFAISPDGRFAATGAKDASIQLWDLATHKSLYNLGHLPNNSIDVALDPTGKLLAATFQSKGGKDATETVLIDPGTGKNLRSVKGIVSSFAKVAFTPDGKTMAVGYRPPGERPASRVIVWATATGKELWRTPELEAGLAITDIAFSGDGRELVVGGPAGFAVWPAGGGDRKAELQVPGNSTGLAVSRDGLVAVAGDDAIIRLYSLADRKLVRMLEGHVGTVKAVAFSPDGTRLISAGGELAVKIWDVRQGRELLTFRDNRRSVVQVGWSADGTRVASCGYDGSLRVWTAPHSTGSGGADWPVLFADAFDGPKLGPGWNVGGDQWAIENGEAVAPLTMKPIPGRGTEFPAAYLRLVAAELPATFELRYTVRVDKPMLASSIYSNPKTGQSLQPYLMGNTPDGGLSRGAALLMMTGSTAATTVGVPRAKFAFEPNRRYKVRVVREPKNLTFEVDGVEVLEERVPDFVAPFAMLMGAWGEVGAKVRFDDVELRAPAAAVRERAVRTRADKLFDERLVKDIVAEELAKDATLAPADRQTVAAALELLKEDDGKIKDAALAALRDPKREPAAYRLASRQVEWLLKREPENGQYLFLRGIGRWRNGEPSVGVRDVEAAMALAREKRGAPESNQWAVLALAAHAAGDTAKARDAVVRLRDNLASELVSAAEGNDSFNVEALRELAPIVRDIETKDAEAEAVKKFVWDFEQAGWLRGDLTAYMAGLADDYREVRGRTETPAATDAVYDRKQVEAIRRMQFHPGRRYDLRDYYDGARVSVDGDRATLAYTSALISPGWRHTEAYRLELRRRDGRWLVAAYRNWRVSNQYDSKATTFTAENFVTLDKAVDEAAAAGNAHAHAEALKAAKRFTEGWAVARKITEGESPTAGDWALRGELALEAGDAADATASFAKALGLNSEVELPWYLNRQLWIATTTWQQFGVTVLPDGRVLTGGGDKLVTVRDPKTGAATATWPGHSSFVGSVAASADGTRVASVALQGQMELILWDAAAGKPNATMTGHTAQVYRVAMSGDGRWAVTSSADNTARVWDLTTGQTKHVLRHAAGVLDAVFSPDGRTVATASHDNTAKLWDVATGGLLHTLSGHRQGLQRVSYSPDGTRLVTTAIDKTVRVWDAATGKALKTISTPHKQYIEVVGYHPDGRHVVTGDAEGRILVWEVETGRRVLGLKGHSRAVFALAFDRAGQRMVSVGGDGTVRYWDVSGLRDLSAGR